MERLCESKYSMLKCCENERTKRARTVSRVVISFGKSARFVSFRYCRNTSPVRTQRERKERKDNVG